MRLTLQQIAQSRFPTAVGLCQGDLPNVAALVNEIIQRLLFSGGETGWWGNWQKIVFQIPQINPYITLPRRFARIINLDMCHIPIRVQNEFYEVLEDGIGLQPGTPCSCWCGALEGYERGVWPTMTDIGVSNQLVRAYITDPRDSGARILINGLDQNGNQIYSTDVSNEVAGFYLNLTQPFATSDFIITAINAIQKDATYGDVLLKQVDADTGAEVLLARYAADEINPAYRRYYINQLPPNCCSSTTPGIVQVTAIAKLEFIPVVRPTDFLIISNLPALIEEGQSLRYSSMDVTNAVGLELKHHRKAVKLLQDELRHYLGELHPAVIVNPAGLHDLEREAIGALM